MQLHTASMYTHIVLCMYTHMYTIQYTIPYVYTYSIHNTICVYMQASGARHLSKLSVRVACGRLLAHTTFSSRYASVRNMSSFPRTRSLALYEYASVRNNSTFPQHFLFQVCKCQEYVFFTTN